MHFFHSPVGEKKESVSSEAAEEKEPDILDLTFMSSTAVYSEVLNMMTSPEQYRFRKMKINGIFGYRTNEETGKMIFGCVILDATQCCEQGIEFIRSGDYTFPDDYPEPGDQIFFDYGGGINHTGIVIDVNDFAVITVEGNSNEEVQKNSYPLSASFIAGYGRPNWAMDGVPEPIDPDIQPVVPIPDTVEVTAVVPTIKYGDESMWVKVMQTILIGKGFSCGWYGADGEFGTQTKIGLFQFRQANGLPTDDIICDADAWDLLLKCS